MIEIKALVADDDPQLQDIMVRRLQKAGLNPDRANDGQMALDLIEKNNYDLIVTDIYMPGVTGLALLRRAAIGPSSGSRASASPMACEITSL